MNTLTDKDYLFLGSLTHDSRTHLTEALERLAACRKLNMNITDGVLGQAILAELYTPLVQAEKAVTLAMTKLERASAMSERFATREKIVTTLKAIQ